MTKTHQIVLTQVASYQPPRASQAIAHNKMYGWANPAYGSIKSKFGSAF
ncbi:MAG: hypothetical protein ACREPR_16785 [Brasilonema sp.]